MSVSDCLFCNIAAGDIPAQVVLSSPRVVAFRDIASQAPTHILVIPRAHYPNLAAAVHEDPDLVAECYAVASQLAIRENLTTGYRLVVNTGPDAGQSVEHLHIHLLGGRQLQWPPG